MTTEVFDLSWKNQPRDAQGRWTETPGGESGGGLPSLVERAVDIRSRRQEGHGTDTPSGESGGEGLLSVVERAVVIKVRSLEDRETLRKLLTVSAEERKKMLEDRGVFVEHPEFKDKSRDVLLDEARDATPERRAEILEHMRQREKEAHSFSEAVRIADVQAWSKAKKDAKQETSYINRFRNRVSNIKGGKRLISLWGKLESEEFKDTVDRVKKRLGPKAAALGAGVTAGVALSLLLEPLGGVAGVLGVTGSPAAAGAVTSVVNFLGSALVARGVGGALKKRRLARAAARKAALSG